MHSILLGKNLQELQGIAQEVGLPAYTGKQMAEWIYKKRVTDIAGMTNISQKGRAALAEKYVVGRHAPVKEACSADGTKKYLFAAGDGQWVYRLFDQSRNYRNSISDASAGPIKKAYAVYCDIIDEAGGIAAIATILASGGINIKNIGIVHNREFEEGVLRIEFYEETASKKAAELLQKYRYIVYER